MTTEQTKTHLYRGRSLDELVPRIRQELGDDAVIVARRETSSGGVGGFFAKREIEVEVRPGAQSAAMAEQFAEQLSQATGRRYDSAEAPRPTVSAEVDALPGLLPDEHADATVDDLFPPATPAGAQTLADLFNVGRATPQPEPASLLEEDEHADDPFVEAFPEPASRPARPAPAAAAVTPPAARGGTQLPPAARVVAERMAARGLGTTLAEEIAGEAINALLPVAPDTDPGALVVEALARRIPLHPLRTDGGLVAFIGPGGSGKTRAAARLAAAHARHGQVPVGHLTLRGADDGSELSRLLAPYGVERYDADGGAEGAAVRAQLPDGALVVVDTAGFSPRSSADVEALAAQLAALAPDEVLLVIPATIGPEAAGELLSAARALGVDGLVLSHADETEHLGTVVRLAIEAAVPLSYVSRGQAVDVGLAPAVAFALAAELTRG
jgi:flagellar biosynthesis protein FlhF